MKDIIESGKEALRVVVLSIIPIAIDGFMKGVVDLKLIIITAAVAALRFVDKWLHETGKADKGITRF